MANSRDVHPNALPNYDKAIIATDKLKKYCLDPYSNSGRHKARAFKSILGFDLSNWELLRLTILEELPYYEAEFKDEDIYGKRYTVVISISGPTGSTAKVLTGWIIDQGADYPRMTTARVLIRR